MTKAVACLLLAGALAVAEDLSVGKLLVATRKSRDPDFAGTVVLLVHHDREASIGLFINRPLTIPLSEVYPELNGAQLKLYAGGPVTVGVRALYRSAFKPPATARILNDVFMISTKSLLGKMVAAGTPGSVFRIYAGYAGWSAGQLHDEVARGLWHVFDGDAGVIFDPHPETVWQRLSGRLPRAASHFRMRNILEKSSVQARKPV
jgi:putative transcriptional regulator